MICAEVRLDLCVLADTRLGDAAGASHAAGVKALAGLGYRIGLLGMAPDIIAADTGAMDLAWAALFATGQVTRLASGARVEAKVAMALDSRILSHDVRCPMQLRAEAAFVTVERPAHLSGLLGRETARIAARAAALLGAPVIWAPGNVLARDALVHLAPHWPLTAMDWPLVLPDFAPAPRPAVQRTRPVAGRARLSRARGLLDMPEEQALADPRIAWRLRSGPGVPRPEWPRASPVEIWPDDAIDMADFLARMDVLALPDDPVQDPCPIEALLAMAAGVVPLLDPGYRPVFGAGALYAVARDLPDKLADLHDNPAFRAEMVEAGQQVLDRLHRPQDFANRLAALIGPPRADAFAPAVLACPRRTVIFYATNGVGMGHLTRQLAIARRLPPECVPVFLSHSQAVDVVRQFGFAAEHLPYHATYRQNRRHWNVTLGDRLQAAMAFWQPAALVYDGNIPFPGLLEALARRPEVGRVWVRRGLWGAGRDPEALAQSPAFDLILEPGEPADIFDDGPTADRQAEAVQLPAVRLLDEGEIPDRIAACAALGLDPAAVNVFVAPGSGNNSATQTLADQVLAALSCRPGIGVALAEWRIATLVQDLPPGCVRLQDYPFARHIRAFDFAVAAAGYNTFAEHLSAALPTIWTPNEAPEQDQQILRARFATERGLGMMVRLHEGFRLGDALAAMLAGQTRAGFALAGRQFAQDRMAVNGAHAAADAVASVCSFVPCRMPLENVD